MQGSKSTPQRPLYSGAPDLSWVPSTRVSSPFEGSAPPPSPAPTSSPRPVLKGPKLPPPLPPVRQVVLQAATSWKRRNGNWRKHARFVVESGEALAPAAVAVATLEAETPKLPIMPPIVSAVDASAIATVVEAPPEALPPVEAAAADVEAPLAAMPVDESPAAEPATSSESPTDVATSAPAPVNEPAEPVELSASVPALASAPRAAAPALEGVELGEWDVLLLAGPVGAGKSSVARRLTELLPHGASVQFEPMRDKNFTSLVGQVVRPQANDTASTLELWSGQTTEARPKAVETAKAFIERGLRVVLDDQIETVADLRGYQQELDGLRIAVVTLMPSIEELELRDKLRPQDQQFGKRLADYRAGMIRQMGEHATVIDTSTGTTDEIVERILAALRA
ncbi:MAG TPA: hypothetical protein V6D47_05220 [Oscillatoriaceae cyanobacterium]